MKRLLVIRYGGFGDAVMASSILPHLKSEGWQITVDASPMGEAVLRYDPNIDHILVTPQGSVPAEQLPEYWNARTNGFHRVINLCESVEVAALLVPKQLGFFHDDETRRRLCGHINYVEHTHKIAGVPLPARPWYYPLDEELHAAKVRINSVKSVVVCLTGSAEYKTWPNAMEFLRAVLSDTDAQVFLAGATRDEHLSKELLEAVWPPFRSRVVDMTSWHIRESLAVACLADAVVGPETGIMNAVSYREMRKVLWLSHSSHENLSKNWMNTVTITPAVPCHPCHRLHSTQKFCPRGPSGQFAACSEAITGEQVLSLCIEALR
jgi:ADP-heptose:LPS heptosyltransferase